MATVRTATASDHGFLLEHERPLPGDMLRELIRHERVLVAESAGTAVGWLRWGFFWDEIPFMNMLVVLEEHRGRGVGTELVRAWEQRMFAADHSRVLTSTMSDETAQHFYRRRGYIDSGCLLLPGEATELIFRKELSGRA